MSWKHAAVVALLSSSVVSAQQKQELSPPPKVTGTPTSARDQELQASIEELKASRAQAPEGMKKALEQQIQALEKAREMQKMVDEANARDQARRPKLSEETKAFFTPVAPAKLPVWLPDTLTRAEVKEDMLKCPAGAQVFAEKDSLECRLPPKQRGGIPPPHGLALWFYKSNGKLEGQRFYENGLLRWAIAYHTIGGRSSEGLYDDEKPKQHRQSGLHTDYAPNGTITRQAEYKSGVLQGWSKLWEDDGFPMAATRYENGKSVEAMGPEGKKR